MKKSGVSKKKIRSIDQFAGQWVAFLNNQIIGSKKTLDELMKEMKRKKIAKDVSVMLVPRKDEGPYILFLEEK